MAIAPEIMDRLLVELCRFLIDADDAVREMAPARSVETAAYELACNNAALETLRTAIATRDREMARDPLQDVAARLGIPLDEDDQDWHRLAFRALRVMLDAEQENLRRDQGLYHAPSPALLAARARLDTPAATEAGHGWPLADHGPGQGPDHGPGHASSPAGARAGQVVAPPVAPPVSPPVAPPVAAQTHRAEKAAPAENPQATRRSACGVASQGLPEKQRAEKTLPEPGPTCPTISEGAACYIDLRSKGYLPAPRQAVKTGRLLESAFDRRWPQTCP